MFERPRDYRPADGLFHSRQTKDPPQRFLTFKLRRFFIWARSFQIFTWVITLQFSFQFKLKYQPKLRKLRSPIYLSKNCDAFRQSRWRTRYLYQILRRSIRNLLDSYLSCHSAHLEDSQATSHSRQISIISYQVSVSARDSSVRLCFEEIISLMFLKISLITKLRIVDLSCISKMFRDL